MLPDHRRAALVAAWEPARRAGVLGGASLEELWEHTAGFASAVCSAFSAECSTWNGRILDAGTGAGVPGVLLAEQFPSASLTLVDASDRRLDHVRSALRALDLGERVAVRHGRMDDIAHEVSYRARYDAVVARLFGDPLEAAELLLPCVRPGGVLVVSARPDQVERWEAAVAVVAPGGRVELTGVSTSRFITVSVGNPVDVRFPRRPAARERSPLI